MTAYIISRGRPENLRKTIPRWAVHGVFSVVVIEASERQAYLNVIKQAKLINCMDFVCYRGYQGLGHIRQFALKDAATSGLKSIVMSDDDLRPAENILGVPGMRELLVKAGKPDVLGIGATHRYHDFLTGGVTRDRDDVILCPSGWGLQFYALNVETAMNIGGYDKRLDVAGEDAELVRQGIAAGIPWLVHCGARCEPIGKRHSPGGLESYPDLESRVLRCQQIIHDMWPDYTTAPPLKMRTRWVRMLDDFIPGWQARSAMHGGNLETSDPGSRLV